jgi:uncharacterized protein YutE (UPF0331/DUF86 family)
MQDRLILLEDNVRELIKIKDESNLYEIKESKSRQWSLRYGLLESIQIVIDISCHLAGKYNLGNPQSYSECIELLAKNNYLDSELSKKLKSMIGLRNILVHEYIKIDVEKIYGLLDNIEDFSLFADKVKDL